MIHMSMVFIAFGWFGRQNGHFSVLKWILKA